MRYDDPSARAAREELASACRDLLADGLAVGRAGNLSVRDGDLVLITPSGVRYQDLDADGICAVGLDGRIHRGGTPSTEAPMHLAIYAATGARAIVHTHSPEVVAFSSVHDELPAVHYAMADLGGPVRVAPYHRFGSAALAGAAVTALRGRRAAILANHGAVCYGDTLGVAYERAAVLEWLARLFRLARTLGTPRLLTEGELAEVAAETRRIGYGGRPADEAGRPADEGGRQETAGDSTTRAREQSMTCDSSTGQLPDTT